MSRSTLTKSQVIDFVNGLELADIPASLQKSAGHQVGTVSDGQNSGSIDAGSLVSFTAGVSDQHRSDCLNSTLLAQLAADKKFDRFASDQIINWYKFYTYVLGNIGWAIEDFSFQNYQASGSTFSIDTAIIEIVTAFLVAGSPEVAVVEATLKALTSLGSDDPWYQVWDQSTHNATGGNFQIAPAGDTNGAVNTLVMNVAAFSFTTTETATRFLWTDYQSSDTQLHYAHQSVELDEDVYSPVRQGIIKKLGARATTFIHNLDI